MNKLFVVPVGGQYEIHRVKQSELLLTVSSEKDAKKALELFGQGSVSAAPIKAGPGRKKGAKIGAAKKGAKKKSSGSGAARKWKPGGPGRPPAGAGVSKGTGRKKAGRKGGTTQKIASGLAVIDVGEGNSTEGTGKEPEQPAPYNATEVSILVGA